MIGSTIDVVLGRFREINWASAPATTNGEYAGVGGPTAMVTRTWGAAEVGPREVRSNSETALIAANFARICHLRRKAIQAFDLAALHRQRS